MMTIPLIESAKRIELQFHTGEEPVMVMCSDLNTYVCKYMRTSATAYKLACEYIGARMANAWQMFTPPIAFVRIKPSHWEGIGQTHSLSSLAIGSKWLDGMVDITPSTFSQVTANEETLMELMRIALFDLWIANEDRNANNANLMYDVVNNRLVSIDYGCILNTATFEYPLSQLTSTDTILCSDLFHHLTQNLNPQSVQSIAIRLKREYDNSIRLSRAFAEQITEEIPIEWNVPSAVVNEKLRQLFEMQWTISAWDNFLDYLSENIQ